MPDPRNADILRKAGVPEEKIKELYGYSPMSGQYLQEHPYKATFELATQPLSQTFGGKNVSDMFFEAAKADHLKPGNPVAYWANTLKLTAAGSLGTIVDMAQTPSSYLPMPAFKFVGKIPFRGSTLGEVAGKVPASRLFDSKNWGKVPYSQLMKEDLGQYIKLQEHLLNLPKRVAKSRLPLESMAKATNPEWKIINLLTKAKPLRAEQEALYSAERSKRAGAIDVIGKKYSGENAFKQQLAAAKGELPKVGFPEAENAFSQGDLEHLFLKIQSSTALTPYDTLAAKGSLVRMLSGEVPTKSEIDLLSKVFSPRLIDTLKSPKTSFQVLRDHTISTLNLPRAIMSTSDLSAPLRQGAFFLTKPKQFFSSFGKMFDFFASESSYEDFYKVVKQRPDLHLMQQSRLGLTHIHDALTNREESFISTLPEKIPYFGKIAKASNRAHTGFLNKLRVDLWDDYINRYKVTQFMEAKAKNPNLDFNTFMSEVVVPDDVARNIASFINAGTGRGNMMHEFEQASALLNGVFYSPRLISSRLTLINPVYYAKLDPFTRKEALKSAALFYGGLATTLGVLKMSGVNVGVNPISSDFGKIIIGGKTRVDLTAGFGAYFRIIAQVLSGQRESSMTGVVTKVNKGYKPVTRLDFLGRFFASKEAPLASLDTEALAGRTFEGKEFDLGSALASRAIPLLYQDAFDFYQEYGEKGLLMVIPAMFGVSFQVYHQSAEQKAQSIRSIKNAIDYSLKHGDIEEANRLLTRNSQYLKENQYLIQYQDVINALENKILFMKEQKFTSPEERDRTVNILKDMLKERKTQMQLIDELNIRRKEYRSVK